MAAAKIRVTDIAKRMGKSEKDVIFQLQSLGAEITDANQILEPEVIQALITGKKLTTRARSVIMREDKPQPEKAKKEAVRPPRPIVKPTPRTKVEAPKGEEAPAAPRRRQPSSRKSSRPPRTKSALRKKRRRPRLRVCTRAQPTPQSPRR